MLDTIPIQGFFQFRHDLLPQALRPQDVGIRPEAQEPALDLLGGREFEFRQQAAIRLWRELSGWGATVFR